MKKNIFGSHYDHRSAASTTKSWKQESICGAPSGSWESPATGTRQSTELLRRTFRRPCRRPTCYPRQLCNQIHQIPWWNHASLVIACHMPWAVCSLHPCRILMDYRYHGHIGRMSDHMSVRMLVHLVPTQRMRKTTGGGSCNQRRAGLPVGVGMGGYVSDILTVFNVVPAGLHCHLDPAVHRRCRYNSRIQSDTWYVIVDPLCECRGAWCHASRCEMPSCLTWVESYSAVLHGGHSIATSGECNLKIYERT